MYFYDAKHDLIKDIELFYKIFRLEAVVTYQDRKKVEKKAAAYVKKNPEKATLIAAGVGAALGTALTKALRRKK